MEKTAQEIIQQLEDMAPEPIRVENFAAIWDGPLGFAWGVRPERAIEFAARLREMANSIEGFQGQH